MGARAARERAPSLGGLFVGWRPWRNDGVLVGAALALAFAWDRWAAWRSGGSRRPAIPLWAAVACFALFIAILAPWFARQLAVFGSIAPSSASGWCSSSVPSTNGTASRRRLNSEWLLQGWLAGGEPDRGLVAAIVIISVLVGGILLVPFAIVGDGPDGGRSTSGRSSYAGLLFAFCSSRRHVLGGISSTRQRPAPHAFVLAWRASPSQLGRGPTLVVDATSATRFFTVAASASAGRGNRSALVTQPRAARRDDFRPGSRPRDAGAAPQDR
jgi:hypothetical protein